MTAHLETPVLIVGGGPTGLVMALALDRLGVRCTLVERRDGPDPHPKAHELGCRSVEILAALGIASAELAAEAAPADEAARIVFGLGVQHELGRIELDAPEFAARYARHLEHPPGYFNLSQSALEARLWRAVEAAPAVDARRGCTWRALETDDDGVTSTIEPADGPPLTVRSRYVVAADGAGSRIRKALGVPMVGPAALQHIVNAYFEGDATSALPVRAKLYWVFDPRAPGTLVAHHCAKRWVFHVPLAAPYESEADYPPARFERMVRTAMGADTGLRVVSIDTWRVTAQVAERFTVGRVMLVGDAAHRFPPTGGLGMNSGIGDAYNLAWKLAAVLGGADPALLDTYEVERRPIIEENCASSLHNYRSVEAMLGIIGIDLAHANAIARWQAEGWGRWLPGPLRRGLLSLARRIGRWVLGRRMADPARQARFRAAVEAERPHFDRIDIDLAPLPTGAAVLDDGSPADPEGTLSSTRPGSRWPHVWLDEQQRRSSHRLIAAERFTLIADGIDGWHDGITQLDHNGIPGLVAVDISGAEVTEAARRALVPQPGGAVLVRPDGYVGARWGRVEAPAEALRAGWARAMSGASADDTGRAAG